MIYFIVNPAAKSGKANSAVPIIDTVMRGSGLEYSFIYTSSPGDIDRVAGLIDFNAVKSIICVGGDGTVQEYVGLAVKRNITFGVIPAGSSNDSLYSIPGYHKKIKNFNERIIFFTKKVIAGNTIYTDVISVNNEKYFFNIGGTGIDINVLKNAEPLKKFFSGAAYFISLIKNIFTYKAMEMTVTVDNKTEKDKFLLLAVCNGAYYGGKLHIAPPAAINDGLITLCKVKKMPKIKLTVLFPSVKPGYHTGFKQVSFIDCSSVKFEFDGKKDINLDGNLFEYESPITFEIIKDAVNFII